MKISAIILNYLTYDKTISCIHDLQSESILINHIIIIDNNSNNNSIGNIHDYLCRNNLENVILDTNKDLITQKYILYQNPVNSGYACGNNIGIEIALNLKSDYILILNNDVRVLPNAIKQLVEFTASKKNIGCVGPIIQEGETYDFNFARNRLKWFDHFLLSGIVKKIKFPKIILKHHFIAFNSIPDIPFKVDMISGSCMLFPASVLKTINGFDINTFLYYEEAIICEKLRAKNLETFVIPTSKVIHEHAASIKQVKPTIILKFSLKSQYYYLNKVRFYPSIICHIIMTGQYLTYFGVLISNTFFRNENSH